MLKFPLLELTNTEIEAVAAAFAEQVRQHNYTCYACAILPDHVHLLIRKHRDQAEAMIDHLQDASRDAVRQMGRHSNDHPVWGGRGWKVFLESREDIQRTIAYVRKNASAAPTPQSWPFVKPYAGWLPGLVRVVRRRPL